MNDGMIKTKQEVERFLHQFGIKFDIWGIFYLDRVKNEEALKALGITPKPEKKLCVKYSLMTMWRHSLPTSSMRCGCLGETWTVQSYI